MGDIFTKGIYTKGPKCGRILTGGALKMHSLVFETRPAKRSSGAQQHAGNVENNPTDRQALLEKSHKAWRWKHKNSKCPPPAPVALRTGTADEDRGTRGRAMWGPICSMTARSRYPSPTSLTAITMHLKQSCLLCQVRSFFSG